MPRPPCRPRRPYPRRGRRPVRPTSASASRRALRRCCGRPTRRWRRPGCRSRRPTSSPAWRWPARASRRNLAAARAYAASVPPIGHHHRCARRLRRRPWRQGWRHHHRRHRQRRMGCRRRATSIASAAGAFRSRTKAAAPGSAARWRAACCGRTTAACAWTGLLEKGDRALRRRSARHRALDGRGAAARLCSRWRRSFWSMLRATTRWRHELMRRRPRHIDGIAAATGCAGRAAAGAGGRNRHEHRAVAGAGDAGAPGPPQGDALSGALQMARHEAETMTLAQHKRRSNADEIGRAEHGRTPKAQMAQELREAPLAIRPPGAGAGAAAGGARPRGSSAGRRRSSSPARAAARRTPRRSPSI